MQYEVKMRKKGENKIPKKSIQNPFGGSWFISLVFFASGAQDLHQEGKWANLKLEY